MKKLFLTALTIFIFNHSHAQSKIIKTNLLGLSLGFIDLSFETTIKNNNTAMLSIVSYSKNQTSGYGTSVNYNYYFEDHVLRGWHVGPYIGILGLKNNESSLTSFLLGVSSGHQWVFDSNFTLDVFAKFGLTTGNTDKVNYSPNGLTLGVSLGYSL